MDAYNLYNIAKEYAEKVWQERGDYVSTYYATITVVVSDGGHIYTGITGITVNYGDVEIMRSEKGAIAAMLLDGQSYAKQMVTLSFKTRQFAKPDMDSLKLLYELDHRNAKCVLMTGEEYFITVGEIIGEEYDPDEEPISEVHEAAAEYRADVPAAEEAEVEYEAAEPEVEEAEEEYQADEAEEEYEDDGDEEYVSGDEQPDFLMGFDFGDDTGPTSEIVVPKIQKSYEEYDKINIEKRADTSVGENVEIDEDNPFFSAGGVEQREVVAFADMEAVKQEIEEGPKQPTMSKKEMLKLAKQRKKIAKNNNRYR